MFDCGGRWVAKTSHGLHDSERQDQNQVLYQSSSACISNLPRCWYFAWKGEINPKSFLLIDYLIVSLFQLLKMFKAEVH